MPLQSTETVAQPVAEKARLQVVVSPEADLRIAVEAAKRGTNKGEVITSLVLEHLPRVDQGRSTNR